MVLRREVSRRAVLVGHHQAQGPDDVDIVLSLRDLPSSAATPSAGPSSTATPASLPKTSSRRSASSSTSSRASDRACHRGSSMRSNPRVPARRPGRPDDSQPAVRPRPTTLLRGAVPGAEVPGSGSPRRFSSIEHAPHALLQLVRQVQPRTPPLRIGLMTPDAIHHCRANAVQAHRARNLTTPTRRLPSASPATAAAASGVRPVTSSQSVHRTRHTTSRRLAASRFCADAASLT
jgi:hypothetical protein